MHHLLICPMLLACMSDIRFQISPIIVF